MGVVKAIFTSIMLILAYAHYASDHTPGTVLFCTLALLINQ